MARTLTVSAESRIEQLKRIGSTGLDEDPCMQPRPSDCPGRLMTTPPTSPTSPSVEGAHDSVLSRSGPDDQTDIPGISYLRDAASTESVYCELLAAATGEILVFNRPPFAWALPELHPAILQMLGRGISARVLYRRADLQGTGAATFREETGAYIEAGLQARVVEELPTKLVVMDRRAALMAMLEPASSEEDFPPSLHIEHPGLAQSLAAVFEHYWATAAPYGNATS